MDNATLTNVLGSLGWSHSPRMAGDATQGRRVYDNEGGYRGNLTAQQTWTLLRCLGLVK